MARSRPGSRRRVALLVEASRAYARGLIRGVARYNRERGGWQIQFTPRGLEAPPPAWLDAWEGEGLLARIDDRRTADAVARKRVPVVELRRLLPGLPFPSIGPDDAAVSRLVFDHFRERGFRRFGFAGAPRGAHPALDARADGFARCAAGAGLPCRVLRVPGGRREERWRVQGDRIAAWLRSLERPAAVMACSDDLGLQVLDACRRAGIRVPDDVAVAGVGNDACLCGLSRPPLSSVDLDAERIGYEAALLLDRMMDGRHAPARPVVVPPRCVVARPSTDALATDDAAVVRAVRFIREHAVERIRAADVLRQACVSRTSLEPRLKRVLGRTIHQEIARVRLERVRELLAETVLPLKQVAARSGFRNPEYLMRVFRRATGTTPGAWRRSRRGRTGPA